MDLNISILSLLEREYHERNRLIKLLEELNKSTDKQEVTINLSSSWSGILLEKEFIIEQVMKNIDEKEKFLSKHKFDYNITYTKLGVEDID